MYKISHIPTFIALTNGSILQAACIVPLSPAPMEFRQLEPPFTYHYNHIVPEYYYTPCFLRKRKKCFDEEYLTFSKLPVFKYDVIGLDSPIFIIII